jgi:hypothetical protein
LIEAIENRLPIDCRLPCTQRDVDERHRESLLQGLPTSGLTSPVK